MPLYLQKNGQCSLSYSLRDNAIAAGRSSSIFVHLSATHARQSMASNECYLYHSMLTLDTGKGKQREKPHESGHGSTNVIEIDSDKGYSSDIQEIGSPVPVLRDSVNRHKQSASEFRLNTKPASSSDIPAKSKEWLKRKKDAHAAAVDPKKMGPVMFRCDLFLQTQTGKKTGTRVPMQSRGFQQSDVCSI